VIVRYVYEIGVRNMQDWTLLSDAYTSSMLAIVDVRFYLRCHLFVN